MIRKATYEDVPELMEVFGKAREIMRASGNLNQWNEVIHRRRLSGRTLRKA